MEVNVLGMVGLQGTHCHAEHTVGPLEVNAANIEVSLQGIKVEVVVLDAIRFVVPEGVNDDTIGTQIWHISVRILALIALDINNLKGISNILFNIFVYIKICKYTHNVGKECVLLALIGGDGEATNQLIRFQIKYQYRVGSNLLGIAKNICKSRVQNPQAITGIYLNAEGGNDGFIVLQLYASICGFVRIQTATRGRLLLLWLHFNGQLVGIPIGIRTQLW